MVNDERPSRTAYAVAQARAQHHLADHPRIFHDPIAVRLIGEGTGSAGDFDAVLSVDWVRRRRYYLAARSRFADETIAAEIARGTRQVVILGAGLDTSAYRATRADVRFFEVDHPNTQAWKRRLLAEADIAAPPTVTFVPTDFEGDELSETLATAGFRRDEPVVSTWLGVIMYLTGESITHTLRYLAAKRARSVVAFDYLLPPDDSTDAMRRRAARVAQLGEPWLSCFTPDELKRSVLAAGFTDIDDRPAAAVVADYLGTDPPGETSADRLGHLVRAAIGAERPQVTAREPE